MIYKGLLAELGIRCTQVELRAGTFDHQIYGQGEMATVLHGLWNSKPDQKLKFLPFK